MSNAYNDVVWHMHMGTMPARMIVGRTQPPGRPRPPRVADSPQAVAEADQ